MIWLLSIAALLFSWTAIRRAAAETSVILALGLTPMLAASVLIGVGNALSRSDFWMAGAALLVLSGLTLLLPRPPDLVCPQFTRSATVALYGGAALTTGFVVLVQLLYLDTDNWIHEPLIANYMLGLLPPVHPWFPEIEMNGHYGRDLLFATVTPLYTDPLATAWILNPLFTLATYLVLFGTLHRYGSKPWPALLATWMAFFGICVGVRVGLADTFDGNNGLVYALATGLFYWMFRVLELDQKPASPAVWLLAGFQLGIYQLVYETHFGLLLLTACVLVVWTSRTKRVFAGVAITLVVALALAVTEGGPFTYLAQNLGKPAVEASKRGVGQHVSLAFPKEAFLQAKVTTADYQRLSIAYQSGPFKSLAPEITGEGYMYIVDPRFLYAHWLPLYLAPLVFWVLWRRRCIAGMAFWVFGLWSYLIPGLVDFGPIWEWEYFRWEFSAGFGFAIALGLVLGLLWEENWPAEGCRIGKDGVQLRFSSRLGKLVLIGLTLIAAFLPGEKMANNAIIRFQKTEDLPLSPGRWRVAQTELGVTEADLKAMDWLAPKIKPGDRVMANLGDETPQGLWPDSVLAARTGCRLAGRAKPPTDVRIHAHPNCYRSPEAKLFFQTGRIDVLYSESVDWLLLDLDRFRPLETLLSHSQVEAGPVFTDSDGNRRQVFALNFGEWQDWAAQPPFEHRIDTDYQAHELRAARLYPFSLSLTNPQSGEARPGWIRCALDKADGTTVTELHFLAGSEAQPAETTSRHELAFATPLEEGDYRLAVGFKDAPPFLQEPVVVNFRERLSGLTGNWEMPDQVAPKKIVEVELRLTGEQAITSEDELDLMLRVERSGGEPVWEIDALSHPLNLSLRPGEMVKIPVSIFTPWEPGLYYLQGSIRERASGRVIPLGIEKGHLRVVAQ